ERTVEVVPSQSSETCRRREGHSQSISAVLDLDGARRFLLRVDADCLGNLGNDRSGRKILAESKRREESGCWWFDHVFLHKRASTTGSPEAFVSCATTPCASHRHRSSGPPTDASAAVHGHARVSTVRLLPSLRSRSRAPVPGTHEAPTRRRPPAPFA